MEKHTSGKREKMSIGGKIEPVVCLDSRSLYLPSLFLVSELLNFNGIVLV